MMKNGPIRDDPTSLRTLKAPPNDQQVGMRGLVISSIVSAVHSGAKIHDNFKQSEVHLPLFQMFLLCHYSWIQRAPPSGKLHSQPPNPSRGECRSTLADQIKHLTEIAERERVVLHVL